MLSRRRVLAAVFMVACVAGWTLSATAQVPAPPVAPRATGTPTVYKVTFLKFELRRADGSGYVTVFDSARTVDIASTAAGGVADQILGQDVDEGTYDAFRATISTTFRIAAVVAHGGPNYGTTGGAAGGFPATMGAVLAGGGANEVAVTIPGAGGSFVMEQAFSAVTIGDGDNAGNAEVRIDVTGSAGLWEADQFGGPAGNFAMCVTQPSVTVGGLP